MGKQVSVVGGPRAEIVEVLDGSRRIIRFSEPIEPFFTSAGHVPLPPYIHTTLSDPERYQTVYARQPGSAAAPTAGLHFTPRLLEELLAKGVRVAYVTLHVGLDTFAPVNEENPEDHKIHTEWCELGQDTANMINQTRAERRKNRRRGDDQCTHIGKPAAHASMQAVYRTDKSLHPARIQFQPCGRYGDKFPFTEIHIADAGKRLRGS